MLKWVILAVAAYFLYRLFRSDFKKKQEKQHDKKEMERRVATGEMVRDPECGAYIDADSAITVRDGDAVHRFCSYECRDAFLKRLQSGSGRLSVQDRHNAE